MQQKLFDSSGNGNNGTVYNGSTVCGQTGTCPQWGTSYGKFKWGWSFDGVDDGINASTSSSLTSGNVTRQLNLECLGQY